MIFRIPALMLLLAALLIPRPARGGQPSPEEPRYDPATTVEFTGVVIASREVPRGSPMHGLHLTVENGKDSFDVYLGPMDFMKQFNFTFGKGDRIDAVGSRLKLGGTTVVLAREVRRQNQTVYLRDSGGNPYWLEGS
ncbi:MAG: hypothetical protein P4L56_20500 [Candidatus Sulfopaludibacter sp.]|nr:hypothetical protein [Candidatus Sulfopaludibacter sp.]